MSAGKYVIFCLSYAICRRFSDISSRKRIDIAMAVVYLGLLSLNAMTARAKLKFPEASGTRLGAWAFPINKR